MMDPQNSLRSNNQLTQIPEFNFLPPEIWFKILAKLPAKTLLKFRCVCKSWCSIIDDPYFHIHFQLSQIPNSANNNNSSILTFESLDYREQQHLGCLLKVRHAKSLRETDLIIQNQKYDLYSYVSMGSCNGLILVGKYTGYRLKELRLWNPCIRKSLIIPACPFSPSLLENCHYLFGYGTVSNDYKIVAIESEEGLGNEVKKMFLAVYTLRDQQWTVRNDGLNISFPNSWKFMPFYCLQSAVFVNGVAYWLGIIDNDRNGYSHLGSFDFDKEEIAFSKLPSSWDESGSVWFLFLLGESLAIFRISKVASSIWVLEQDNKTGKWTQRFSGKSSLYGYRVFRLMDNTKVFFCESDGGYFILGNKSYNIASCEIQESCNIATLVIQLEMYLESLVLSKGYGARDLRFFP